VGPVKREKAESKMGSSTRKSRNRKGKRPLIFEEGLEVWRRKKNKG